MNTPSLQKKIGVFGQKFIAAERLFDKTEIPHYFLIFKDAQLLFKNCHRAMVITMDPARRSATYEDLLKVPDILIAEIVDGELITSPRPTSPHARAASVMRGALDPFDRGTSGPGEPGGWWMLFEPELHLGADILVPDLAGWRRERMPILRDVPYFEQAPDWVCELVSPGTARLDRVRKMPLYAREQVGHLWLVYPTLQTLEVYRLEGQRWVVASSYGGAEVVRAEPFAVVELDIGRWWLEPEP
jgi:Uma2 family endonuclease